MNASKDWQAADAIVWHSETIAIGDIELCTYRVAAAAERPIVLMLHGMRDVAASLQPVAAHLLPAYNPILVDLRGHGASTRPGAYAIEAFLYDLHELIRRISPDDPVILFGHSLGGQLVARFSGLWPNMVRGLVIAEGLGPPKRVSNGDEAILAKVYAERLLTTHGPNKPARALPGLEFAAERLRINNPRLTESHALWLAQHATTRNAAKELVWSFDPRVQQVFVGTTEAQGAALWRQVQAPSLILTGDQSHEYWRTAVAGDSNFTGKFEAGEYAARAANFRDHELVELANAGHMLHFDQPDEVGKLTLDFLERRL